ncbi:MAG: DEAD/DEAH box helicase [Clostridium sp.]
MIERLAEDAFSSEYYKSLYKKVIRCFCGEVLPLKESNLSNKELRDVLRFADIFSNSKNEKMRNLSYRIISLLNDKYSKDITYIYYSNAVLKKLDNFPALKKTHQILMPIEREIEHIRHKDMLKSPIGEEYFLPNQYKIYDYMINNKSLTFSGPTSMGKSFIIKQFIFKVVKDGNNKNFCVIVPTRALIKQYVSDLNKEIGKNSNYKILTNANILEFINVNEYNYIFVLTQERLNVLLYGKYRIHIDYLLIDEAHKLFDEDIRGLTLFSSVDSCISKNRDIKIFFASPLIQNPEIFKVTYNNEKLHEYKSNESPVNQNLFYIDISEQKMEYMDDGEVIWRGKWKPNSFGKNKLYYKIGKDNSNIIYLSSKEKVIEYANSFVEYITKDSVNIISKKDREEIDQVCSMIESNIHKDYYLIRALRHGIAYHYGNIPTIVRESIEDLFKRGIIKYIFCTSTLLEGVNLPAKNIFIMANYKGRSKMSSLDFWNLSGRAGRLGYEYYGNVFCVNDNNSKRAWKDTSMLSEKYKIKVEDKLEVNLKKKNKVLTEIIKNASPTEDINKNDKYNNYLSNIIQIDSVSNSNSTIIKKLSEVDNGIIEVCPSKEENINYDVINSSKNIDYKIQKELFNNDNLRVWDNHINYDTCVDILNYMYDKYRWDLKESRLQKREKLEYVAFLMTAWINGSQLSEIIGLSIEHYKRKRKSIRLFNGKLVMFESYNIMHINVLINKIIYEIDSILRFDLEKYFTNYYNILVSKYGEDSVGINWSLYLEFGTRDIKNIILQNAGFSRYSSIILLKKYSNYIIYDDKVLIGIDDRLLNIVDEDIIIYRELKNSSYLIELN